MRNYVILPLFSLISLAGISQTGNIGIGTVTPLEKLSVWSPVIGYGISHEAEGVKLSTYIDAGGGYFGTVTNSPFHLYTNNGIAQFTLLPNGNIGIGNITPQFKLDIAGRTRIRTGSIGNIFTTSGIWMEDFRDGSSRIFLGMQDSIRLGIWGEGVPSVGWGFNFNARNGNVGIGITDPTHKLEVAGTLMATGAISSNGDLSAGGNVAGNAFQYNTPKTFYYSITPADFVPSAIHMTSENDDNTFFDPLLYNFGSFGGSAYFTAPVHLPDGATVTGITAYFYDNSNISNLIIRLQRRLYETDTYVPMCTIESTGTPGDSELSSTTVSFPVISNQYHNFTVYAGGSSGWDDYQLKVRAVRISYTMTQAQ